MCGRCSNVSHQQPSALRFVHGGAMRRPARMWRSVTLHNLAASQRSCGWPPFSHPKHHSRPARTHEAVKEHACDVWVGRPRDHRDPALWLSCNRHLARAHLKGGFHRAGEGVGQDAGNAHRRMGNSLRAKRAGPRTQSLADAVPGPTSGSRTSHRCLPCALTRRSPSRSFCMAR